MVTEFSTHIHALVIKHRQKTFWSGPIGTAHQIGKWCARELMSSRFNPDCKKKKKRINTQKTKQFSNSAEFHYPSYKQAKNKENLDGKKSAESKWQ